MFETVLFYAFAAMLVVSAVAIITARNPVHAVLCLVLCFFTTAGLWLLLRAEFLAIVLVLVCVGAVTVLFLLMMPGGSLDPDQRARGAAMYCVPMGGR